MEKESQNTRGRIGIITSAQTIPQTNLLGEVSMQPTDNHINADADTRGPDNNAPFTTEEIGKAFFEGFMGHMKRQYHTRYDFKNDPKVAEQKLKKAQAKRDRRAQRNINNAWRNARSQEALRNAQIYGRVS